MGLDTSHDCWHGPYSMFNRWRTWLASQIGVALQLQQGFGASFCRDEDFSKDDIEWLKNNGKYGIAAIVENLAMLKRPKQLGYLWWEDPQHEPLTILLWHSDCDGRIRWWECKPLAIRLTQIYRQTVGRDVLGHGGTDCRRGCYDSMRSATIRFAAGCLRAYKAREDVIFC